MTKEQWPILIGRADIRQYTAISPKTDPRGKNMRNTISVIIGLALAATMTLHVAQAANQNGAVPDAKPGNLAAAKKKPQKGVIFIKGKRFTTCTDWGKHEGWCEKNL
jgi:hypothetical protein